MRLRSHVSVARRSPWSLGCATACAAAANRTDAIAAQARRRDGAVIRASLIAERAPPVPVVNPGFPSDLPRVNRPLRPVYRTWSIPVQCGAAIGLPARELRGNVMALSWSVMAVSFSEFARAVTLRTAFTVRGA